MRQNTALKILNAQADAGRAVFTRRDLDSLFRSDRTKARKAGIARLVEAGWLKPAARGVYVYPPGLPQDGYTLERIARALRRGEYNYISLESALSEWGAISQIPLGHLTVMTTGRKGVFRTAWGTLELTHTARPVQDILQHTVHDRQRPLRIATPEAAWRDLKRVGRNTEMVNQEELQDIIQDRAEALLGTPATD
ncbi:type IV toxin-antitoxin system AbiEi family antitoxin domain-containing protein [Halorhodospira sp. 9622]|nr:type IV toxin-antitoxin system AbiEi family antitoxin domain-containing protein [Halorhodospira sp. 9622]